MWSLPYNVRPNNTSDLKKNIFQFDKLNYEKWINIDDLFI